MRLGGHGGMMHGKDRFELWKQYLADLMSETAAAFSEGASLDASRKRVASVLEGKYRGKFPDTFPKDVLANVEKAYRVISGQTD